MESKKQSTNTSASAQFEKPNDNDVILGRGGGSNHHKGNKRFRLLVEDAKPKYNNIRKFDKARLAWSIVERIKNLDPSGRFLIRNEKTGLWVEAGAKKALRKTSQALREKQRTVLMDDYEEAAALGLELENIKKPGGKETIATESQDGSASYSSSSNTTQSSTNKDKKAKSRNMMINGINSKQDKKRNSATTHGTYLLNGNAGASIVTATTTSASSPNFHPQEAYHANGVFLPPGQHHLLGSHTTGGRTDGLACLAFASRHLAYNELLEGRGDEHSATEIVNVATAATAAGNDPTILIDDNPRHPHFRSTIILPSHPSVSHTDIHAVNSPWEYHQPGYAARPLAGGGVNYHSSVLPEVIGSCSSNSQNGTTSQHPVPENAISSNVPDNNVEENFRNETANKEEDINDEDEEESDTFVI